MKDKKDAIKAMKEARKEQRKEGWKDEVAKQPVGNNPKEVMLAAELAEMKPMLRLNDNELALYNTIGTHLEKLGMLAAVDTIPLTLLAKTIYTYQMAAGALETWAEHVLVHTNGAESPSVAYNIMTKERKAMMDLFNELGLDFETRRKLIMALAELNNEEEDPFA